MLGDNIRLLRKQKGYSQETLAQQLHVVRQTVSKWETGASVPDAELLQRLAEVLETPVSTLLGGTVPEDGAPGTVREVAVQLAVLNEQLAMQAARRRKLLRRCALAAAAVLLLALLSAFAYHYALRTRQQRNLTEAQLTCTLDGETYLYDVRYNDQFQILEAGGDAWIANHVQTEQYEDANVLIAQVEDYFRERGGTCTVTTAPVRESNR